MSLDIHARATDLVVKALQLSQDSRIELVHTVLRDAECTDAERKKIHELVRKACEARDKIAISLYTVPLLDPRQLPLDFQALTPEDFR